MDIRTLLIIIVIINLFLGIFSLGIQHKQQRVMHYWIAANFILAIAMALLALREVIPAFSSIVVGNTLLLMAIMVRYVGYKKLLQKTITPKEQAAGATLLIIYIVLFVAFTYWHNSMYYRLMVANAFLAFVAMLIGRMLMLSQKKSPSKVYLFTACTFFFFAAVATFKIIILVAIPRYGSLFQDNFINEIQFVAQILIDVAWTILLLLIHAEIALKEQKQSEERYKTLSELTFEGILIHNHGITIDINMAFTRLTGYYPDELIGQNIITKLVHPDDMPVVQKYVGQERIEPYQVRAYIKDGSCIEVELESRYFMLNDKKLRVTAVRDLTRRKQQEADLKAALRAKDVLLKELHHRVKNNLQTIVSLLNQQKMLSENPETASALRDSLSRVMTLALVHQYIYRSNNLEQINIKTYIDELVGKLSDTYKEQKHNLQINTHADELFLDIDQTTSISLIINEIISNAFKYAFPKHPNAKIEVSLYKQQEKLHQYKLTISDNGIGFPENMTPEKAKTLGLYLIKNFAKRQLKGTLQITSKPNEGVKYEIEF